MTSKINIHSFPIEKFQKLIFTYDYHKTYNQFKDLAKREFSTVIITIIIVLFFLWLNNINNNTSHKTTIDEYPFIEKIQINKGGHNNE